jgi:ABC-type methionine transport system ATPase subunit
MPGPAVLLSHVGKTYHEGDSERIVLRDVSVAIAPGEIAVLVGRSGSGKSTLLNLIAGIDRPTAGRVLVDGTDLTALDEDARTRFRRRRIGFVLNHEHNLLLRRLHREPSSPGRHIREEVAEALRHCGMRQNGIADLRIWQVGQHRGLHRGHDLTGLAAFW